MTTDTQPSPLESPPRSLAGVVPLLARSRIELEQMLAAEGSHHASLGQFLLKEGLVSLEHLRNALRTQQMTPVRKIGDILVDAGYVSRSTVNRSLIQSHELPRVSLADFEFDTKITSLISAEQARTFQVMPLMFYEDVLVLATSSLPSAQAVELLRFTVAHSLRFVIASRNEIEQAINANYQAFQTVQELEVPLPKPDVDEQHIWHEAEQLAMQVPLVQLLNSIITDAINQRASDIHIRPSEKWFDLLYRVDGSLLAVRQFGISLLPAIVSRIKILSRLNIAEHRLPQDGRIRIRGNSQPVDLRISIIPVQFGESVVIRILNKSQGLRPISEIGLKPNDQERFLDLIRRSYGIILVTGPTGSGKSTTLYAALQEITHDNINVVTVEDPIEYELAGARQIQINPAIDFGFAQALRHILRHDPDVIMIGEMRDIETCKIAMESALTGHLVFSTLHTNDAPSALVRLMEIGIAPYLIRSAVIGILAQRLVRKNCPDCLEEEVVPAMMRVNLGLDPNEKFYRGGGCKSCRNLGFKGRLAIYELLVMNDELRARVNDCISSDDFRKIAIEGGMVSLPANGVEQARMQQISIAEVYRACM